MKGLSGGAYPSIHGVCQAPGKSLRVLNVRRRIVITLDPSTFFITWTPLLGMLTYAAVVDVRSRRIPNWLSLTVIITGILQAALIKGGVTPGRSLLGMLVGFVVPFALYAVGALGAGDVKLLAGVGAWVGPWPVVLIILVAAIIGGVFAVGQSLWQGRLLLLLRNTTLLGLNLLNIKRLGVAHVASTTRTVRTLENSLPYAVPILIATVLTLFVPGMPVR